MRLCVKILVMGISCGRFHVGDLFDAYAIRKEK